MQSDAPYVVEERGERSLFVFAVQKDSSAEQWVYGRQLLFDNKRRRAKVALHYLVRRWPNSLEAPLAQRKLADLLYQQRDLKDAFEAYQYLIDNYASRMGNYDEVLDRQFKIAVDLMNHRRMRILFGGYRAPEYAVEYFESVIKNGPQWSRAAEAQYLIGQAYQEADELELAIAAYSVVGYRYASSSYAEESLWQKILCLNELRQSIPDSLDVLDRFLTSTTLFLSSYPDSKYRGEVIVLRNQLYEVLARRAYDEAEFYVIVPKKPEAAILGFKRMIEEFPKSVLVPRAKERIAELEAYLKNPNARQL